MGLQVSLEAGAPEHLLDEPGDRLRTVRSQGGGDHHLLQQQAAAQGGRQRVDGGLRLWPGVDAACGTVGLQRLTEPSDLVHADEGAAKDVEGKEDVSPSLVAHAEATHLVQPGMGALDHPAVTPQALTALHPAPGDARADAAGTALATAAPVIVALVGVQLARPPPRASPPAAAHGRHGIQRGGHHSAVMLVGGAGQHADRSAPRIDADVPFAARFATIGRVRARLGTPLFAATLALSRAARLQSSCPAACRRSSSTRCSAAHTPASCQSRSLRQQLMPEPHPISAGSISQGRPDLNTNKMPLSAARSGTRGRPPFGLGRSGGNSGAIIAHRSSGTSSLAMPPTTRQTWFR